MSHRGRALRAMRARLVALVEARTREATSIAALGEKRGGT
jgi:hypothetical protein